MNKELYTFLGCTKALEFYINASEANEASDTDDKQTALNAAALLSLVSENLMLQCAADSSEATAKEAFATQVTTILEAIEQVRNTAVFAELNSTLTELLDQFYNTAESIMGGGGQSSMNGWPTGDGDGSGGDTWWSGSNGGSSW